MDIDPIRSAPIDDLALLTSAVARILGVSADRVRMLERDGQLPAQRTEGGVRLFSRADVMRLKAARERAMRRSSSAPGGSHKNPEAA
jgi:excisionase family DNA binding protein